MKRALSALLLALLLPVTVACNSDQTGDSNTDNQNQQPPQPTASPS
jgi:hypothetical protein